MDMTTELSPPVALMEPTVLDDVGNEPDSQPFLRSDAVELLGSPEALELDTFAQQRLASMFPDIIQADTVEDIPTWGLSVIRAAGGNADRCYLFVEANKNEPSDGMYHVRTAAGGLALVSRVVPFGGKMVHEPMDLEPDEYHQALAAHRVLRAFLKDPVRTLAAKRDGNPIPGLAADLVATPAGPQEPVVVVKRRRSAA